MGTTQPGVENMSNIWAGVVLLSIPAAIWIAGLLDGLFRSLGV